MENNDISKTVVVVLVILSVLISILGTWVTLSEISNVRPSSVVYKAPAQGGRVSISIISPSEKATSSIDGKVTLTVIKPKGEG